MIVRKCQYCPAHIVFVETVSGSRMPIDADAMSRIVDDVHHDDAPMYDPASMKDHVHWRTCPGADRARRERKGK